MVEVTRRLEEKLSPKHRAVMRCWWRGLLWLPLLLWPQRTWLAVKYNWQKRRSELFLQCMLPVMAVLAVVTSLTVFGVTATLAAGNKDSSVSNVLALPVVLEVCRLQSPKTCQGVAAVHIMSQQHTAGIHRCGRLRLHYLTLRYRMHNG